ncbi:TLC domain-containing protein 2-like [Babylonia areolata]|uniref:TLC domain-containing protein 2-like n=1 Tax=Babylonia areolata TaxID=304850 RepID=UPI003FD1457B
MSMEWGDPEVHPVNEQRLDDGLIGLSAALSVVFFLLVNEALKRAARRYVTLQKTSQWRWRNLAVSWVHADFCAVGCLYCYAVYGHHVQSLSDLLDLRPLSAYLLVAFSTGYFLYDMLDHLWNGQALAQWEVTAHHVAVIAIFGYNLWYHVNLSFSVLALTVEVNSVFLHGRKLLQMLHVPFSHWFYRLVVTLNLLSFLAFRGPPLVLIWLALLSLPQRFSQLYVVMLGTVMVFMVILNPVLFWRLLKNDLWRKQRPVKPKEDSSPGERDGGEGVCVGGEKDSGGSEDAAMVGKKRRCGNGGGGREVAPPNGDSVSSFPGEGERVGKRSGQHSVLNRAKAS